MEVKIDINEVIDKLWRKMQETIELYKNKNYNKKLDKSAKEKFEEFDRKFINNIEQILPVNFSYYRPDDAINDLPLTEDQKVHYTERSRLIRSLSVYWFARYKDDINFGTMNLLVYFHTYSQLSGLIIEYIKLYLDIQRNMTNTDIIRGWESLYDEFKINYNRFIEESNKELDAENSRMELSKIVSRDELL